MHFKCKSANFKLKCQTTVILFVFVPPELSIAFGCAIETHKKISVLTFDLDHPIQKLKVENFTLSELMSK